MKRTYSIVSLIVVCGVLFAVSFFDNDKKKERFFFDQNVMANAMGGMTDDEGDPEINNNHVTALEEAIDDGYMIIEVDVAVTSDDRLVCSHRWSQKTYEDTGVSYDATDPVMTYEEFMKTKIHGRYTTMDIEDLVDYVRTYDNILWEINLTDIPYEKSHIVVEKLIEAFSGDTSMLERLLIQVESQEMYDRINEVYAFQNYQYNLQQNEMNQIDDIIEFCVSNQFQSIAVNVDNMEGAIVRKIKKAGLQILCYTIDDEKLAKEMLAKGADCISTNFILPKEI